MLTALWWEREVAPYGNVGFLKELAKGTYGVV